ncbi:MAG: putative immunity protein [Candidatus Hodarchaeota archaeon]
MQVEPRKKKPKFSLTHYRKDERIVELVKKTNHKTLAAWAIDCAVRVLPYFEEQYPEDQRPRKAIETLKTWINTGVFQMAVIRQASLDSHAAAREVGRDNAARSAARAAGQAVATAHVPTHSIGSAIYALQAIHRATNASDTYIAVAKEREWQFQHLLRLREELASE